MAKTRQIGFRLPEDEYQRIMVVFNRAKERTLDYAPLGDVIREACGIKPLKLITQQERDYLAGKLDSLPEINNIPSNPFGHIENAPVAAVKKSLKSG